MTSADTLILAGALVAGFVQGLSGFALGLVAMVFWSGVLPPQQAAPLIALASLAGQVVTLRTVLPRLDWRRATPMVLGGVLGVPVGVMLLSVVDAGQFRLWVGILLCLYCPAMLFARRLPRIAWGGAWADGAAGAVGGVMGGIAGLNGPAPTLWCMLRGWPPDQQRAMYQPYLIVAHTAALVGFALAGFLTRDVWRLAAWVVPCALAPSVLGTMVYARMPAATFRQLVLALLLLTGVVLVAQGS